MSLRRMRAVVALTAAVTLTAGLSACGGGEDEGASKDEYKKQAQQISDKLETDFQASLKNATSKDPQESLTGVNQITSAAREAADAMDGLEPPSEYEAVHGKLLGSLRTLVTRGEAVARAAEGDDVNALRQSVTTFQQGIRDLDAVGNEFDRTVGTT